MIIGRCWVWSKSYTPKLCIAGLLGLHFKLCILRWKSSLPIWLLSLESICLDVDQTSHVFCAPEQNVCNVPKLLVSISILSRAIYPIFAHKILSTETSIHGLQRQLILRAKMSIAANALITRFKFEKLLNQDQGGRRIILQGKISGQPASTLR